jgi:hypothetical protein
MPAPVSRTDSAAYVPAAAAPRPGAPAGVAGAQRQPLHGQRHHVGRARRARRRQRFARRQHRVARVDDEVHQHLLSCPVGVHHRRPVAVDRQVERHLVGEQPAQQLGAVARQVAQLQPPRLLTCVRLNASSCRVSCAAPLRGVPHVVQVARELRPVGALEARQLGAPDDRAQQVVEVVRHAAGEQPEGVHLLRLAHLLLQPPPLGDVARDPHRPHRPRRRGTAP